MPQPKVKPLSMSKKNYTDSASQVRDRYVRGIEAGKSWKAGAASDAAEDLWRAKIEEAAAARRRQRAIDLLSEEDWKRRALDKGASQIGPAMQKSGDKWEKGFRPYADALSSVNMDEKQADAMANIDGRLKPVVQALIDKKREIKG